MKKSILDPSFRHTPSAATDLRKTFAGLRREQRKQLRLNLSAPVFTDAPSTLRLLTGQKK